MKHKRIILFSVFLLSATIRPCVPHSFAQEEQETSTSKSNVYDFQKTTEEITFTMFDDKMLLDGYRKKYENLSKDVLLAMIQDEGLNSYKIAAAVRVFTDKHSQEVVSKEKKSVEKIFLRRLNRTDSPFIQVEILYALCQLDRYRYFKSMVPALIQKLKHYNTAINDLAFENLNLLIKQGQTRPREARIVFNTLRKTLFLTRRRLSQMTEPDPKLSKMLELLRWSIKILGRLELKKLPKEVLHLL
ncbi:MAG: hypothetical protein K8S27_15315 [Candidatus Omnitrophica bacterium]|nr:hypothetical protein [Candidatus Omnitrophota bacterium]